MSPDNNRNTVRSQLTVFKSPASSKKLQNLFLVQSKSTFNLHYKLITFKTPFVYGYIFTPLNLIFIKRFFKGALLTSQEFPFRRKIS